MATKIQNFSDLKAELRQLDCVRIVNPISKNIKELDMFIGVAVSASSVIRKESHTKEFMQQWCKERGLTLVDPSPFTTSLQILLNQ